MAPKEAAARPLMGYQLVNNPNQPGISVIAFDTSAGPSLFVVTRDMLEQLAAAFIAQAAKMPKAGETR